MTEPGYDALIVRRSYSDLEKPGALIPLSKMWLPGKDADYNEQTHRWTFPSGATLSFGHIQNETSVVQDYQGSAFAFIGFDELTQFTEFMYRYLFSRLRKAVGLPFPARMRATSNPGGIGHDWVKARFLSGANGFARLFIPSLLEDNPGLDREAYEQSLSQLDPVTRAQLRHGNWDIRPEGNLFKRSWFDIVDRVPAGIVASTRFWDLAATEESAGDDPDATAGVRIDKTGVGVVYVADVRHFRGRPSEVERNVRQTAASDGFDVAVRIEQEPGSAGKALVSHYARDVLPGYDCRGVPSRGDKVTRAQSVSAACERGDVKLVRGAWNAEFLDQVCAFPAVPHDDMVDGLSGAFNDLFRGAAAWAPETVARVFGADTAKRREQPIDILRRNLMKTK